MIQNKFEWYLFQYQSPQLTSDKVLGRLIDQFVNHYFIIIGLPDEKATQYKDLGLEHFIDFRSVPEYKENASFIMLFSSEEKRQSFFRDLNIDAVRFYCATGAAAVHYFMRVEQLLKKVAVKLNKTDDCAYAFLFNGGVDLMWRLDSVIVHIIHEEIKNASRSEKAIIIDNRTEGDSPPWGQAERR